MKEPSYEDLRRKIEEMELELDELKGAIWLQLGELTMLREMYELDRKAANEGDEWKG